MAPVTVCGLWAGLIALEMTDLVNAPMPPSERLPILFANHRFYDLGRKYRELFPEGDPVKRHDCLWVIAASSFGLTVLTQLVIQVLPK
jgi:hypothetical protein